MGSSGLLVSLAVLLPLSSSAQAQTLQLKRGVALEGWLDRQPFQTIGEAELRQLPAIRASGFDFVRVLVHPRPFLEARSGVPEPVASLERILRAARQNKLRVLVSFYDEGPDKQEVLRGGAARDTYLVLLERFAGILSRHDPQWVGFEPIDQAIDPERPDCSPSSYEWGRVQGSMIAAARRGAPRHTLVASGLCYSTLTGLSQLRPFEDRNLIYSFQYIDPLLFTQQGNPVNPYWTPLKGVPYPLEGGKLKALLPGILKGYTDPAARKQAQQELEGLGKTGFGPAQVKAAMAEAGGWAQRNGVKVLLKAFAVNQSAPRADRMRWFRDVRQEAEAQKLAWTAWTWTSPYGYALSEGGKLPLDLKKALGL